MSRGGQSEGHAAAPVQRDTPASAASGIEVVGLEHDVGLALCC